VQWFRGGLGLRRIDLCITQLSGLRVRQKKEERNKEEKEESNKEETLILESNKEKRDVERFLAC
jgi:hypothetical protein